MTELPVRYTGGKWRIADWLIGFFPPHMHYVEPFCGGASVLFRKYPSTVETINDLDGAVVNFFRVLRDQPDDLLRAIELTPYSREELQIAQLDDTTNPVERARRFYILSRQAFGSSTRTKGWRYLTAVQRGRSSQLTDAWNDLSALEFAVNRLKQVQIEHDDALAVIQRFDTTQTLFYVDPPYVINARSESRAQYRVEMTDDQHRDLARVLHGAKGMTVLSGYHSPLYDELFGAWPHFERETRTNGGADQTEVVWLSPNIAARALPLFSLMATGD